MGCIAAPNNQSMNRASDVDLKSTLTESQRRRSSSIAEQAMRKLSTGSNYGPYYEQGPPVRENGHLAAVRGETESDSFGPHPHESVSPLLGTNRLSSNRMLSVGLDKRIMKQSTEDCRRLLQQATAIADTNQTPVSHKRNPVEMVASTQPKRHAISPMPIRMLTSSNSFDMKSNPAALLGRFQMSAEAAKLFNTLQESPLPLNDPNEEMVRAPSINYHKSPEEKIKWLEAMAMKDRSHNSGYVHLRTIYL